MEVRAASVPFTNAEELERDGDYRSLTLSVSLGMVEGGG